MLCVLPPTIEPVFQRKRLQGLFSRVHGKTGNNAIQLFLQHCCKTSCTFFVVVVLPYLNIDKDKGVLECELFLMNDNNVFDEALCRSRSVLSAST